MSALHRPPDWTRDAACVGLATRGRDLWTPSENLSPEARGFELHLARRICASCPVRTECVVDELARLQDHAPESMRGGLAPDELIYLAKDLGIPHRRRAQHGSRSRYVAGCRCDLCRDAHRIYEHERRLWAKTRRRTPAATAEEVLTYLARPIGRGKHRAGVGQLVLFTTGLPARYLREEEIA